jgi:hypothetical protein
MENPPFEFYVRETQTKQTTPADKLSQKLYRKNYTALRSGCLAKKDYPFGAAEGVVSFCSQAAGTAA